MILNWIKRSWKVLNEIHPETRSIIIILLFGWILYALMNQATLTILNDRFQQTFHLEKRAELYTKNTAVSVNELVKLIAHRDLEAFDVLLLSYHNSKLNLQGYKYLYLSCLTEAPQSVDTPLLKTYWNNLDYVYYADELERLHNQSVIQVEDINDMAVTLPKLYRLVKISEAKAVSFYIIEGKNQPIGMIVMLYKETPSYARNHLKYIMSSILKLAILLDYENSTK